MRRCRSGIRRWARWCTAAPVRWSLQSFDRSRQTITFSGEQSNNLFDLHPDLNLSLREAVQDTRLAEPCRVYHFVILFSGRNQQADIRSCKETKGVEAVAEDKGYVKPQDTHYDVKKH